MNIHSSAIVHPDAQLADDVEVQAFTLIGSDVVIGAGSVVGPHCVIDGRTQIGTGNRFFSGAQIGVLSQDLKHDQAILGRVIIGDNNVFREHVSLSASTIANEEEEHHVTSIDDDCLFMAATHIAHDCHLGSNIVVANGVGLSGHVDVHDRAILGGLAGLHQETVVGRHAFLGGMSRMVKDALPYMITEGNPVRCVGPNTVGLARFGFDEDARKRIKEMFKILCRSKLNMTQGVQEIERSIEDSDERRAILEFIANSKRGVAC